MSEYLSKEEIKQWRSSLEKITLEEFAARLGKKIVHETKESEDLIDTIFHGNPTVKSQEDVDWRISRSERLNAIAERSFAREREISTTPFSAESLKSALAKPSKTVQKAPAAKVKSEKKEEVKKPEKKVAKTSVKKEVISKKEVKSIASKSTKAASTKTTSKTSAKSKQKTASAKEKPMTLREEVQIVLKKALTDREQRVFDYFTAHANEIVYAKDLADLLELPRDYVYKYIKNLRAKIEGETLQNADKGGFILTVE